MTPDKPTEGRRWTLHEWAVDDVLYTAHEADAGCFCYRGVAPKVSLVVVPLAELEAVQAELDDAKRVQHGTLGRKLYASRTSSPQ